MGTALDPFKCFGRALASHNYKIRHVPYTTLDGTIGTHAYFIKRAAAVIIVTSVTNCEPRVKVLAAGKPLMVLTWNIPVLQDYSADAYVQAHEMMAEAMNVRKAELVTEVSCSDPAQGLLSD